jgi:hypothetical protein
MAIDFYYNRHGLVVCENKAGLIFFLVGQSPVRRPET